MYSFTNEAAVNSCIKRMVVRIHADVRGVLGNKCAGQHNLKTAHFRDTLA